MMHRSCSFDVPTLRNMCAAPGVIWEPQKLAGFTTLSANSAQLDRKELINSVEAGVRLMAGELAARTNA
ncbi:MAG: hypothetical protein ACRDTC_15160 [Pseudonocardiaceae bacterium]